MVDHPKLYDPFGIGTALQHGMRMLLHGQRHSGRTTALLDSLKEHDVVITTMGIEGQRLEREIRARGFKDVTVRLMPTTNLREAYDRLSGQTAQRRIVFDHMFFEGYYSAAIDNAVYELSRFKEHLDAQHESYNKTPKARWDPRDAVIAIGGDPDS